MYRTTSKQADLIISLWERTKELDLVLRRLASDRNISRITSKERKMLIRELKIILQADKTRDWAHAEISRINAQLGWDQQTDPATAKQLLYLLDLEIAVNGEVNSHLRESMTYSEADARIRLLKRMKAEGAGINGLPEEVSTEEQFSESCDATEEQSAGGASR